MPESSLEMSDVAKVHKIKGAVTKHHYLTLLSIAVGRPCERLDGTDFFIRRGNDQNPS